MKATLTIRTRTGIAVALLLLLTGSLTWVGRASAQTEIAPVGTYWQRVPHDDASFGGDGDQVPSDVTAGGPGFVAVGNDSLGSHVQPAVWTSADGAGWQRVEGGVEATDADQAVRFNAVVANTDTVVAVGAQGADCVANFSLLVWGVCSFALPAIWWSENGISWNRVPHSSDLFPPGDDSSIVDVVATDDGFYAIGNRRIREDWDVVIWSSGDGRSWQVAHIVDGDWPLAAGAIESFAFGVVAFITEYADRNVAPLAAVPRGGGYVLETPSSEDPTPTNQLVSVDGDSGGFTDAEIGLAHDYHGAGDDALETWAWQRSGFALGPLEGGIRTLHTTTDGINWSETTATVATEPSSFTSRPHVLPTPEGLVAVQFVVRGTELGTVTWQSTDSVIWQPTGIDPPPLERIDASFTGAGGVPGGVTAVAIDGGLAVAVGTDATRGDGDGAFWFSATGPLPGEDDGPADPGTTFTTPAGCVITTDAECPASNLDGADLSGLIAPGADLSLSNFTQADLSAADLSGANLDGASLQGADLSGANLTGASLESANLSGATLHGAVLTGVELKHTDFTGAALREITAANVDFGGFPPTVGAILNGADLSGADLASADLTATDMRRVNLTGANLTGANLMGAHLGGAALRDATLAQANFASTGMTGADLSSTKAREATFTLADLRGATFVGSDLTKATLFGAQLNEADLSGTTLEITNFVEAILLDATLPAGELDGADWGLTICPDGFVTDRWPSPTCEEHRG